LTALLRFEVYENLLNGSIPLLTGLTALDAFLVYNNQLTGSIPSLAGLIQLDEFDVHNNQLTGSIPSLAGLNDLEYISVYGNQLTGAVPAPPPNLAPGESQLCPNQLTPSVSAAWDTATGQTPWSAQCNGSGTTYTVTPTVNGGNGSVSPSTPQTVTAGGSVTFTSTPNAGYAVSTIGVTGLCNLSTPLPNDHLVSAVNGDCTFTVTFAPAPATFTVTPSVISGSGLISPNTPQTIVNNGTAYFTLTPAPGFVIGTPQGTCSGTLSSSLFSAGPITADCTVGAVFLPAPSAETTSVPTLTEWKIFILSGLVALVGILGTLRRRSIH
jgi:hypothetical protein